MRNFFLILFALSLLTTNTQARDPSVLSNAAFLRWAAEVDDLEKEQQSSPAATSEIAVARQWLEEGRILLGEGKVKKAALIAERMPLQIELIRVLVATGVTVREADAALKEVDALGQTLLRLKSRHDLLILRKSSAEVSGAVPPTKK